MYLTNLPLFCCIALFSLTASILECRRREELTALNTTDKCSSVLDLLYNVAIGTNVMTVLFDVFSSEALWARSKMLNQFPYFIIIIVFKIPNASGSYGSGTGTVSTAKRKTTLHCCETSTLHQQARRWWHCCKESSDWNPGQRPYETQLTVCW